MDDIEEEDKGPPERDSTTGQFIVGHTGMGGRPKGSRNKLAEVFVADLLADWELGGVAAVAQAREKDPAAYVRVVASLLPKENITRHQLGEDMTEDELRDAIAEIRGFLALADHAGVGGSRPAIPVTSH